MIFHLVTRLQSWWQTYREQRKIKQRALSVMSRCGCLCYCPFCKEILQDQATIIEEDKPPTGSWTVKYWCESCGGFSLWEFGLYPIPVLVGKWEQVSNSFFDIQLAIEKFERKGD